MAIYAGRGFACEIAAGHLDGLDDLIVQLEREPDDVCADWRNAGIEPRLRSGV